ncbi:hypothetical protein [Streptomyces sp. NPDC007856]|uniref:hypothetical protein n=1 Tax=Streptomyces sp. NPDC007856 TaxID=3364781 RepID=UPI0036892E89
MTAKLSVHLKPYHPGNAYVDWLGLVGQGMQSGPHRFRPFFGPAIKEARALTRSPVLVAETAAPGSRKPTYIKDLVRAVTPRADVMGFVWLDAETARTGGSTELLQRPPPSATVSPTRGSVST